MTNMTQTETARAARLAKPYDEVGAIIAYEQDGLSDDDTVELFQRLVDNGHAWTLQGHYGRTARLLIEAGYVEE